MQNHWGSRFLMPESRGEWIGRGGESGLIQKLHLQNKHILCVLCAFIVSGVGKVLETFLEGGELPLPMACV